MLEKTPQERTNDFIKDYKNLVEQHNIDVAHYPVFVPLGEGTFGVRIQSSPVDLTTNKTENDIQPEEKDTTGGIPKETTS